MLTGLLQVFHSYLFSPNTSFPSNPHASQGFKTFAIMISIEVVLKPKRRNECFLT